MNYLQSSEQLTLLKKKLILKEKIKIINNTLSMYKNAFKIEKIPQNNKHIVVRVNR